MLKYTTLLLLSISALAVQGQSLSIEVKKDRYGIDEPRSLIVAQLDNIASYKNLSQNLSVQLKCGGVYYSFQSIPDSLSYKEFYVVRNSSNQRNYKLYFTELPLVSIQSKSLIRDEPKTLAYLVYADEEQILTSNIGIEIRGGSSQSYPKKTFDIEFWDDTIGVVKRDVQFKNMRSDDDWILDGIYNEPLRIRSYLASKLWLEMHSPYYLSKAPEAKSGADVEFVELFLNGSYRGLYNLSEQVDRKLLQLRKQSSHITGELYKGIYVGVNSFTSISNYDNQTAVWDGYEVKYPKHVATVDWSKIYGLTDFVVNACDGDFMNNVWTRFNRDNFIDYFIFLNVIRASDNVAKNIYTARYQNDEPYFYVPWDLDGCFGTSWEGTRYTNVEEILTNGFHDRVFSLNPSNCNRDLALKWFKYRQSLLSYNNLSTTIKETYSSLLSNKIYEREKRIFSNLNYSSNQLDYMLDWTKDRLKVLDDYFNELLISIPNKSSNQLVLYPNPATTKVCMLNFNAQMSKDFSIYTISGKLVKSGSIDQEQISLETVSAGTYLVVINGEQHKLVVR